MNTSYKFKVYVIWLLREMVSKLTGVLYFCIMNIIVKCRLTCSI